MEYELMVQIEHSRFKFVANLPFPVLTLVRALHFINSLNG